MVPQRRYIVHVVRCRKRHDLLVRTELGSDKPDAALFVGVRLDVPGGGRIRVRWQLGHEPIQRDGGRNIFGDGIGVGGADRR